MKRFYFIFICCLLSLSGLHAESGNEAEAIIDSGRWIIHFSEMTEDRLNRDTLIHARCKSLRVGQKGCHGARKSIESFIRRTTTG